MQPRLIRACLWGLFPRIPFDRLWSPQFRLPPPRTSASALWWGCERWFPLQGSVPMPTRWGGVVVVVGGQRGSRPMGGRHVCRPYDRPPHPAGTRGHHQETVWCRGCYAWSAWQRQRRRGTWCPRIPLDAHGARNPVDRDPHVGRGPPRPPWVRGDGADTGNPTLRAVHERPLRQTVFRFSSVLVRVSPCLSGGAGGKRGGGPCGPPPGKAGKVEARPCGCGR